jgi:uncharacterized protein YllA (UPF0747 family)
MIQELARIDLNKLGDANRLYLDYVGLHSKGVPPLLPPLASQISGWPSGGALTSKKLDQGEQSQWEAVVDEIAGLSRRLGGSRDLLAKIDRARSREARFVVTGQQPGALGGPLLAAYKIATAVALANRLEQTLGQPCIPLYWCGADDADFQEIRDFALITKDLSLVTASIAQQGHAAGMPVGDIDKEWLAKMWQSTRSFVGDNPSGEAICQVVDDAFAKAKDHGELTAAILVGLLCGTFAVVDGRSAAVRRYAKAVFAEYVDGEDMLKKEVRENGQKLEDIGYHSQLTVGEDSGVFVVESGRRRNVSKTQRAALIEAVDNRVETCSPGVILRNLVQDHTFEPLAVVLGPSEIAYRAQIGTVYGQFGLARPVEFPRMAATFVPPPLTELLEIEGGSDAEALVRDPSGFARTTYRSQNAVVVRDSASEFASVVHAAIDRLSNRVDGELSGKASGKVKGRLREFRGRVDQLSEAVLESGKAHALERWPYLAELGELMRPGDKPQERRLSAMAPFLYAADSACSDLLDLASTHIGEVMDGHPQHIVYSTRS